jgi:hypothetical protein
VDDSPKKIADLKMRLAELDRERAAVLAALEELKKQPSAEAQFRPTSHKPGVVATPIALSNAEKVALFRLLFRGRGDVFALRWENAKTGKAGYAGTKFARLDRRHWLRKENPDMSAIAGAGALKGCRHALVAARRKECQRIPMPSGPEGDFSQPHRTLAQMPGSGSCCI